MSKSANLGFRLGYAIANLNERNIDFKLGKAVKFDIGEDYLEINAYSNQRDVEKEM